MVSIRVSLLSALLGLSSLALDAQPWNPATQARSWAKQDKDDSFTFYDPTSRLLHTWSRDAGILASMSVAKLDGTPERWVVDPRNNVWVAQGITLTQLDRTGRSLNTLKLPAEVGDVCWDAKGFVLSYRSVEPYLEKRDFKGALLWAFGAKPPKGHDGPAPQNRRPIVMNDAGHVLMADGNSLNLAIFDGQTGKKTGETQPMTADGHPAPALEGNLIERDPLALWGGHAVVFAAVKASQIPAASRGTLQGLALARVDLAKSQLEFLPTGLDVAHILVGVLDSNAVFAKPSGGLMLVQIK